jgi:cytochrome c-type biogenesis protein CcmH/NrfF
MSRSACGDIAGAVAVRGLRVACLAGCVGFAASFGNVAAAQPAEEASWGYALANELMSPWCPGFALPDCSSGYASDLRMWILEQERLGRSEDEVRAEILARYGEKMLQAPRAEGRGWLAYLIPAAIIFAGLAVLVRFLRAQRAPTDARAVEAGIVAMALDPLLLSQVDRELASHEASGAANHHPADDSSTDSGAGGGFDSGGSSDAGSSAGSDS